MTVGELVILIGVKGSEKTKDALDGVKKGLSGITEMSLEAKAGILAVLYGLERLMSQSSKTGQNLTNFAAASGLSIKSLQQLQFAAQQAGISVEETEGSISGLQSAVGKMQMGLGAPSGLAFVVNQTKMLTDPAHLKDTFYVFDKVVQYLKTSKDAVDIQNEVAKSFGLSTNMIAAARRGLLDQNVRSKAPLYTDTEAKALDNVARGWTNLYKQWEMGIGRINVRNGPELIRDLSNISTAILKLIDALVMLTEKLKVFKLLGFISQAAATTVKELGDLTSALTPGKKSEKAASQVWQEATPLGALFKMLKGGITANAGALGASIGVKAGIPDQKTVSNNLNVNIQNQGVEGADEIAEHFNSAMNFAMRQFNSINQVS